MATKDLHFIFDGTLYKQIDGVAMGFPLGPTLTDDFLLYHEKIWLERYPLEYRPFYYRRYVDDIFALFNSPEHLKRFQSYLNSGHVSISFTIKKIKDNTISFLDVNIIRKANLQPLSTINQLLAEFIVILTVSYRPHRKLA